MRTHDDEDNWADLADALGIDTPATQARKQANTPPPVPEQPPPLPEWARAGVELPDATEPDGDTAIDPVLATEPTSAEPGGEGDGERKRRRRRRRRRKGGPAEAGEVGVTETESDEDADDGTTGFGSDESAADDDEAGEPEPVGVGLADEPTPDAVRDLIANWNVPSWQEIVSGLYRPGGDRDR
jgi:ribonuclease E